MRLDRAHSLRAPAAWWMAAGAFALSAVACEPKPTEAECVAYASKESLIVALLPGSSKTKRYEDALAMCRKGKIDRKTRECVTQAKSGADVAICSNLRLSDPWAPPPAPPSLVDAGP